MGSVTANTGTNVHRITGYNTGTGTLTLANNIALDAMPLAGSTAVTAADNAGGPDGQGKTDAGLKTKKTCSDPIPDGGLGWDFDDVWKWDGTSNRPVLAWES
jgi:hypothetical protein